MAKYNTSDIQRKSKIEFTQLLVESFEVLSHQDGHKLAWQFANDFCVKKYCLQSNTKDFESVRECIFKACMEIVDEWFPDVSVGSEYFNA